MIICAIFGTIFIFGGITSWMDAQSAIHQILAAILNGFGFLLLGMGMVCEHLAAIRKNQEQSHKVLCANGLLSDARLDKLIETSRPRVETLPRSPASIESQNGEAAHEYPGWHVEDGQWVQDQAQ